MSGDDKIPNQENEECEAEQETTDSQDDLNLAEVAEEKADGTSTEMLVSRLESLIFVSPEPISVRRLARIMSLEGKRIREIVSILREHYQDRGIVIQEVSQGFQFRSHPDNAQLIRHVFKKRPIKISRAALETLAIVAYRQPLTRAEAEGIRGVDCGGVLKFLFEKELVRIIGRKEEPGRPIIYGTSQTFLELFGLKSLSDLPALHEFTELWEDHQDIIDTETPLDEQPDSPRQIDEQSDSQKQTEESEIESIDDNTDEKREGGK